MKKLKNPLLWLIVLLVIVCIGIDLPTIPIKIHVGKINVDTTLKGPDLDLTIFGTSIQREFNIKQGLDLQGGTHLVFEADMSSIAPDKQKTALEAARNIIEKRVNLFGVSEPNIQTSQAGSAYRIIVELPGLQEISSAIDLIGQTAQLQFMELTPEADPADQTIYYNPEVWQNVDVSGADLKGAQVVFSQQTGKPQVQLLFTDEGRAKFSEVVKRNVGKPVGIFLDGLPLSMPRVDPDLAQGLTGDPVITGQFDVTEAKNLSIQLDAGALPVNLKLVQQENVGATLGRESVRKSLVAGIIGLILVMFFMWAYYGKKGFLADIALFIYGLITLALYKLIPVTLTLAGMAGFILAIGMAVDANILIFERIKEELRWGKPLNVALELGFGRAWDSIRDANINTLIVAFILFNPFDWGFLNTSGPVRGFALTLALGIFVSLFTGIVVTRTLLRLVYGR